MIFHIGLPRAGSTTVQHVMASLRPELERVGILYPEFTSSSTAERHLNHLPLGEALDGRCPPNQARELLQQLSAAMEASTADVAMLSYEGFCQQKKAPEILQVLRSLCDRYSFQMEAIMIVRPQSEYLNSLYSHAMQFLRERRTFGQFAGAFWETGRFAYDKLAGPWLQACDGRVRAIPLRDHRTPTPILHRFLSELNLSGRVLPLLGTDHSRRVENRSPGPFAVEVSRRLRLLRAHVGMKVRPRDLMRFVEQLAIAQGVDQVPFKGVDLRLRTSLEAEHAASNARFSNDLWGRPWSTIVAAEPCCPVNEIVQLPSHQDTEQQVREMLGETCRTFGIHPVRPWSGRPAEMLEDGHEFIRRKFRISRWRVV